MSGEIAYDDDYTGPAFDPPKARGSEVIGDKRCCSWPIKASRRGESVADAYDRLYYIERAAQVQIYAMWTGQPEEVSEPWSRRPRADSAGGASIRGRARPSAFRGAQAHARPQGARLRDVSGTRRIRAFFLLPLWEMVAANKRGG